jgi:soluble lytic murein transglycosylase
MKGIFHLGTMTFLLAILFSISLSWAVVLPSVAVNGPEAFIQSESLALTRSDIVVAEHLFSIIKLVEKGYVGDDVLKKVEKEPALTKHFSPFVPWLKSIHEVQKLKKTPELIAFCGKYSTRAEKLPLEKVLERVVGNYCRELTIEAIGRDIEKTKNISEESIIYIQQNLKFYLTKKNRKNFAFFIQSLSQKPEILQKVSQEVTTYSVHNGIVPSQEVLQDIVINDQITKLIQDKGFNPLQHKNVFYAEYGKLIELGYRTLDAKPSEDKVKEHYQFLKNYLDLNQDHLPVGMCLSRLNDFAKAVFRAGHSELSRTIIKSIIQKNNKEIQEDAQFFLLWTHISLGQYEDAIKLADTYQLLKKSDEILDARLKFWIGDALEHTNHAENAIKLYEQIIYNSPLSFYAIIASKRLTIIKPDSKAVTFYRDRSLATPAPLSITAKELDEDFISSLIRLRAWAKIDTLRMMNLEQKRITRHSMPEFLVKQPTDSQLGLKSDLHLITSRVIQASENYLAAFRYLYIALDKKEVVFNRTLLEILYPTPYFDHLRRALKAESFDPIIVLSLIRQESVFNPLARSPVGARGLMQIMPTTARRIKRGVRDTHLVDPSLNIELGTKYFKGLVKRYDGNLVYVLSAYNAGESRVEKWRDLYFDSEGTIIKNIESIPFLETRNYVKLIFRNIFFYKLLMEKKELADSSELNKIFDVNLGFKR